MLLSPCYVLVRGVLQVVVWSWRPAAVTALEIVVLWHELAILRRHVKRPTFRTVDRLVLVASSRLLPRKAWSSFLVTPETHLRWHRQLVANRWPPTHTEWDAHTGQNVTFPERQFTTNGHRRSFLLLRAITDPAAQDRLRDFVLQAYRAHEQQPEKAASA